MQILHDDIKLFRLKIVCIYAVFDIGPGIDQIETMVLVGNFAQYYILHHIHIVCL
jgi:hypothetical protein